MIDLRVIPAEMPLSSPSFSCLTIPSPVKCQPKTFFTTALKESSKVELTWDEENQERVRAIKDTYKMSDVFSIY